MLLFVLMPLILIVGLPLIVVVVGWCLASSAQGLAEQQRGEASDYPTEQWLEQTYQPEPEEALAESPVCVLTSSDRSWEGGNRPASHDAAADAPPR